jgi:hypothetical protein
MDFLPGAGRGAQPAGITSIGSEAVDLQTPPWPTTVGALVVETASAATSTVIVIGG